jgi:release factor glutamine methyltransferase
MTNVATASSREVREVPTVRSELARGTERLARAGSATPRLDAELLLASTLAADRARLVIDARESLSRPVARDYERLLARRACHEPVAYILGEKAFRGITLAVDRRVLIPRPETELLVEVGLGLDAGARVADAGTGSGAVALALKHERPDLSVTGIELSGAALAVAQSNASRLGLEVDWVQADLLDDRAYDVVLANLPYVADGCPLPPDVSLYEPPGALYGGADGLRQIRRLIEAVRLRTDISLLALEVGFDQAAVVSALVARGGFGSVWRVRDLAGHERVVVGRR